MTQAWPAVSYDRWAPTCDTLHAHIQVLGKLAIALSPPEPQLQHGALRLTARGWETAPLPAPDGSGSLVVALDLRSHQAVAEHSDGHAERVPLTPDRPVADVTREVLAAVARLGGAVRINPAPQEVPWNVPLDEDYEHARYDPGQVRDDGYWSWERYEYVRDHNHVFSALTGMTFDNLASLRLEGSDPETVIEESVLGWKEYEL